MKKLFLIALLALGLSSCDAQVKLQEAEDKLNAANKKLENANGKLDSVQTVLSDTRILIDSAKTAYILTLMQYDDTVKQLESQIIELNYMLASCPDSSLIKDLKFQKHELEVQVANMRIEMADSRAIMQKFKELSEAWLIAYEQKYLKPD